MYFLSYEILFFGVDPSSESEDGKKDTLAPFE